MKKKLFSKNKFTKENLVKFFDKEGFYVVVFLCLAVIATTAVYITRDNMTPLGQGNNQEDMAQHEYYQPEDLEPEDGGEQASAVLDDEKEEQEDTVIEEDQDEKEEENNTDQENEIITNQDIPSASPVTSSNVEEEEKQEEQPQEPQPDSSAAQGILNNLSNPVDSTTITMDYSFQTSPVFSVTLNEFRSDHQGVDISAEKGTIVKAAMDGKIEDIVEDPRLGMTVIVDHGHGIKTKYSNLNSDVSVTKNDSVKKGDEIGKAGNTSAFEIDDDDHVHFEVWNGEETVDPKEYIEGLE